MTAEKGTALAAEAVETQCKGSVSAAEAGAPMQRQCLTVACMPTADKNVAQAVCIGTRRTAQDSLQVDGSLKTRELKPMARNSTTQS